MSTEVIRLASFPRHRLRGQELFACPANEVDLLTVVGAPTAEYQPSLGEGTPILFWDLEWPCGLVMGLQFDPLAQRLSGFLDEPEVDHALRHLRLQPAELWLLERDEPTRFARVCPDPPPRTAHLWRSRPDGQEEEVADGLTEREAICRASERDPESEGPYVVRIGDMPKRPPIAPPPSEPPRIQDPIDLFEEMVIDIADEDPAVGPIGGAADHVRAALTRRLEPTEDQSEGSPSPEGSSASGAGPDRPLRRRDLFSMPQDR